MLALECIPLVITSYSSLSSECFEVSIHRPPVPLFQTGSVPATQQELDSLYILITIFPVPGWHCNTLLVFSLFVPSCPEFPCSCVVPVSESSRVPVLAGGAMRGKCVVASTTYDCRLECLGPAPLIWASSQQSACWPDLVLSCPPLLLRIDRLVGL